MRLIVQKSINQVSTISKILIFSFGGYEIIFIWNFLEPEPKIANYFGSGQKVQLRAAPAPQHCPLQAFLLTNAIVIYVY